ncbi:hypothetical protein Cgig2_020249 [Carnegiea gigantea]|uniref:PPC domain-containing protein n=1 Tax=Carnegiea gigantea TaxID=171969 RepID=A0A9Q1QQA8_9CARY|nr:hypothetical protein Cgig2_020249 [Carnegiea gigantea]
MSHSLSPPSDAEEPRDDSLLSSVILHKKKPMPRPNNKKPKRGDAADHTDGPDQPISSPKPVEVAAQSKPRGRPKGSKNKPKYVEPTIKTHLLEIQPGSDIVEMIHCFARTQNAGVSVVNGVGRVRNAAVRNPVAYEPANVLGGTHEILAINGIHVGPAKVKLAEESPQRQPGQDGSSGGSYSCLSGPQSSYLVVQLAVPRGAVWGGVVTGKLVAASTVMLNVCTFANYESHRLSSDDLDPNRQNSSTSGDRSSSGGEPDQDLSPRTRRNPRFHIAVTATEVPYSRWQCRIMYYWYLKVKDGPGSAMGGFTRILHSGRPDSLMEEIPTFVVDPLPHGLDKDYVVLNRPCAFVQWLERATIEEDYVLMGEPDHIFVKPLPNLAYGGNPAAFHFTYIKPVEYEIVVRKFYPQDKGPISNVDPIGSSPVIISKILLKEIAPTWKEIALRIRNDPEANTAFGWVQEM